MRWVAFFSFLTAVEMLKMRSAATHNPIRNPDAERKSVHLMVDCSCLFGGFEFFTQKFLPVNQCLFYGRCNLFGGGLQRGEVIGQIPETDCMQPS